jgi:sensor histidine kinase YesM
MLKLPRYTTKDLPILLWTMIPFSILLNIIIFGAEYFTSPKIFLLGTPLTFAIMGFSFILYGNIAVAFRQRFPGDDFFLKRAVILILLFLTMSALIIFGIYTLYSGIGLLGDTRDENNFTWAYIATGILNIFLTFLNEGIYRFENWKANLKETEQLKMSYKQSQLIGLKSQVNPHFLFNSLNSLSGLIHEDTEKAEIFLNDMSKVYRYMLRNEEEQLVTLETELQFITSYYALLKARYGDGIQLELRIANEDKEKMLPPLSLQAIMENTLYENSTSKNAPLKISIRSTGDGSIEVANSVQRKIITESTNADAYLDTLVRRCQLVCQKAVEIRDVGSVRSIILPLINKTGEVLV